jgi:hypothetical protein
MSRRSSEQGTRGPKSKRQQQQYQFTDFDAASALLYLAIGQALGGGALRIGLTRDGGALAIGIYKGEEYGTEYIRPDEDLFEELQKIVAGWDLVTSIWDDNAGQFKLP